MKPFHRRAMGATAVLLFLAVALAGEDEARAAEARQGALPDFVALAEKLGPVVVNISTTQVLKDFPGPFGREDPFAEFWRRFFGEIYPPEFRQRGLGSGFIIERDGTILTNNHVVENAQKIVVQLYDGRQYAAKIVGRDEKTDLAVIKIDAKGELPVAPLGDSDRLRVGEWVLAMGSPFGLQNTVTAGIVSAKSRQIGAGPYDDFIQTDASINPGNSGGPLINLRGEVVGINTAIFSRTGANIGIGFAIPINLAKELLPELKTRGRVTRGWLGVSVQKVTPEIADSLGMERPGGALVASVVPGSPAAKAGIRARDVIVEYGGKAVKESSDLPWMVARTRPGSRVDIVVLRDKKRLTLAVTVAELKEERPAVPAPKHEDILGLTVQDVTPEIAQGLGLERAQGALITAVAPGSAADDAGLRQGDVILEVDRKTIRNVSDYRQAIAGLKRGGVVLFLVQRGQSPAFIAVKVPREKNRP
ncbi:MAG TPA: DegQ family serine endoprotease [candidate division Zixibacteria bacterium]|nr:DegQ family serine endoprotease [candidate division Zixibacteria bacterium]